MSLSIILFAGLGSFPVLNPTPKATKRDLNLPLQVSDAIPLPTGKFITPVGKHLEVGSYPVNLAIIKPKYGSAKEQFVAVTTIGYRQFLTSIDVERERVINQLPFNKGARGAKEGLYYGLAAHPVNNELFFSRGAQDEVSSVQFDNSGNLSALNSILVNKAPTTRGLPYHPAGIAFTSNGEKLVVANNQTGFGTAYKGSVSIYNTISKSEIAQIPVSGFPLAVCVLTKGPQKNQIAYVASERDGVVDVIDIERQMFIRSIHIGASPVGMILNESQDRLYVANNGSDSVSVIDTKTDSVVATYMIRPNELRGLPGSGPTGLTLSKDGKRLYTALGDMNAVSVTDLKTGSLVGFIPTGWLPTSVAEVNGKLLIACAKGAKPRNPNNKPVGDRGQYIQDVIDGTVTILPVPSDRDLKKYSVQVVKNNRLRSGLETAEHPTFKNPGIKYVIYVIKENRTYDNVLADLKQGNGDPSICLFPREVSPNQHALAERFVLLDNFHVCAEVSQDGWVWSTAGMINNYGSRNTPYNYSGRGRSYDTEGSNNGIPVDLIDLPDVSRPASGYIWEHCYKHGVSYRNYGFFTQFSDPEDKRFDILKSASDSMPAKKLLLGNTDDDFRRYDLAFADSDIYDEYEWSAPRRRETFGKKNSRSRFSEWNSEFQEFVKQGSMPRFQMVRLGNDHTSGTTVGQPTTKSMVADNDYAVGQMVEAVSKSPFWKETVICVLEDDAQNGYDHVDAHRSTAYVISPFVKRSLVDSRFYNTDSMLRTMELVLGMPPMSQYDAVASPLDVFSNQLVNAEPYRAIKPSREIVCAANSRTAYRAKDSERISLYIEEGDIDEDLNDIIWGSIKGPKSKRPKFTRRALFAVDED